MLNEKMHRDFESLKKQYDDLKSKEKKFREIVDMLPETVFEADANGRLTFVNAAGLALFGYSRDDFIKGIEIKNIFCAHEIERINTNLIKVLKGERNQSTEYMALRKDGTIFPVLVHSRPIFQENRPVGIGGVLMDLTENYRIRKQLEREKNFISSLLDTANGLIVCLDSDESILVFNRECERITGYQFEEVRGKNWQEVFIPEENRRRSRLSFSDWIIKHPEDRYEGRLLTKSGEIRIILWSNTVFSPPDSDEKIALAIGHDITERKSAESALRESEQRYSLLFEYAGEAICSINRDGVLEMMNKVAADYLGGVPDDFTGKTMWELFPRKNADRYMDDIIRILDKSEPAFAESQAIINNDKKWFHAEIYPIKYSRDRASSALVIARDITAEIDRKNKMNARYKLLDRLRHAAGVEDCLEYGCLAIREARLFKRAVLTLHNANREIVHLGQTGLDNETVNIARKAKAPDKRLARMITQRKFKLGNSYFVPAEAGLNYRSSERYIAGKIRSGKKTGSWMKSDELFVPVFGAKREIEGWLSVDTPFDGKRPTLETVRFLEEIGEIAMQRSREILNREKLADERKALEEKNIALKEILGHIEEEKAGYKQKVAENIDQVFLPAMNRIIDDSRAPDKSNLIILKNSLKDLASLSGGITQLYSRLSPREIEICNLIKIGESSKEIAKILKISATTVQKHREIIRRKLALTNKDINLPSYLKSL